DIWLPSLDDTKDLKNISQSWFNIDHYETKNKKPIIYTELEKIQEEDQYKAQTIDLKLSRKQRIIIDKWMMAYTKMYNTTLKKIKDLYDSTGRLVLNERHLRIYYLKEIRDL